MSLDYDLTGFLGAGSELSWPSTPLSAHSTLGNQLTAQRQQSSPARHSGHILAASHAQMHTGLGHHGHGVGHHPAKPKKLIKQQKAIPFGEKAF